VSSLSQSVQVRAQAQEELRPLFTAVTWEFPLRQLARVQAYKDFPALS